MTVEPMRDSTTDGLMFVRPIPQGSAPPATGAIWTDEYGWLVPDTRLQDIADAWNYDYPRLVSLLKALAEENKT